MPPYPGEERLVTVFADIHYYFAPPTVRPVLHRFDKASYFYIYYNTTRHTSRIEIANNPGTPEQDAFNGYIDSCRIINSYKFPTLLTIVVDAVPPQSPTSPKSGRDPEEWHLASGDPRDPNRTKYKLHTIDIYLWAQEDSRLVIECFKKLLPPTQLDVAELEPESPYQASNKSSQRPANALSPVVQNLENMAVQDPAYNGQQRNANTVSPSSPYASNSVPPPPAGGPAGYMIHSPSPTISDLSGRPPRQASIGSSPKPQSTDFTPMAYNPAAPAAPEPIQHREKTPPPEDGQAGTGLAQAARHDQGYVPGPPPTQGYQIGQGPPVGFGGSYASPPPQQPGFSSPPPPPPQQHGYSSPPPPQQQQGYASPPPQAQQGYSPQPPGSSGHYGVSPQSATASFNSPPPPSGYSYGGQTDQRTSVTSAAPSFGPGAPSTMPQGPRHSTAAEAYVPVQPQEPAMTPGSQFYNSLSQSSKPLAHNQPQYPDYLSAGVAPTQQPSSSAPGQLPLGGYSQFSYGSNAQPQQQGADNPYDVHQQIYRPTESEAAAHHRKQSRPSASDGRKPSTTDKLEGKAKGLFKRLEKKF